MSQNIVSFPTPMTREWQVFEDALRATMIESGCSSAEIGHILRVLRPIYLVLAQPGNFVLSDADDAVRIINDWVQKQVNGLLLEVLKRELVLFRAGLV